MLPARGATCVGPGERWGLGFVQRCVGEVLAGEGDVKKGERWGLG